jgi:hypothetical protein
MAFPPLQNPGSRCKVVTVSWQLRQRRRSQLSVSPPTSSAFLGDGAVDLHPILAPAPTAPAVVRPKASTSLTPRSIAARSGTCSSAPRSAPPQRHLGLRRWPRLVVPIGLFVLLGLLASPARLVDALLATLVVGEALSPASHGPVVRNPLRMPLREQAFVSWAGRRGAVPIVLATFVERSASRIAPSRSPISFRRMTAKPSSRRSRLARSCVVLPCPPPPSVALVLPPADSSPSPHRHRSFIEPEAAADKSSGHRDIFTSVSRTLPDRQDPMCHTPDAPSERTPA